MLQNVCDDWYGNDFGIEKWWNLKISVHGGFENVFYNYQNLIKGEIEFDKTKGLVNQGLPLYGESLRSQRTPVFQQELFNGHIFIFIRGDETMLSNIKESIEKPKKVLSLGRSEDVVFIRNVMYIEPNDSKKVRGDLKLRYPTYIKNAKFPIKNRMYPVYSIPIKVIFRNNNTPVRSKAEITKETNRLVDFESVIYTGYEYSVVLKESSQIEVEIYSIMGGKKIFIIEQWGWL